MPTVRETSSTSITKRSLDEMYEMGKARSFAEFKKAMARLALPYMNTIYADREGNIFYVYNEAVPRRDVRNGQGAIVCGVQEGYGTPCASLHEHDLCRP